MLEKPAFIQGLFRFTGQGLDHLRPLGASACYTAPADKRAQAIYFRAGNACADMIYLVLAAGGKPMRYFPVGAKGAIHVPLAVLEDIPPGTQVEILLAAPEGVSSSVLLDIGFMEFE